MLDSDKRTDGTSLRMMEAVDWTDGSFQRVGAYDEETASSNRRSCCERSSVRSVSRDLDEATDETQQNEARSGGGVKASGFVIVHVRD
jgi:hypothetical protein